MFLAHPSLLAIRWMLLTGVLAVSIVAIAKHLTPYFHPFQLMFFYCALGALILTPAMTAYKQALIQHISVGMTHRTWWKLQLLRAACEFTAFSLSFYSIQYLMLPTHSAISFSSPIFASLFAIVLLKEPSHPRIWVALALGMLGVLVISNPFGSDGSLPPLPVLAVTLSAVGFGFCGTLIRRMSHHIPPLVIAYMMLVLTALISIPFAIVVWRPVLPETVIWLALLGIFTAGVQFCVAKALSLAPVTRLVPFTYLNLLWAALFSYVFFDEVITLRTIAGAGLIIIAVLVAMKKLSDARERL